MAFSYGWRGPKIIKDGLVVYLDPSSNNSYYNKNSTIIKDISGNGYSATLINGPTYSNTNGGNIVFDGVNDFCSTDITLTLTSATIQAWFYSNGNQTSEYPMIFGSRGGGGDTTGLSLNHFGNQSLGYTWNGALDTYGWNSGLSLYINGWNFLSLTVTPTYATGFLNGTSATNSVTHASTNMALIQIGQDPNLSRFIKGNLGPIYVYNRALSNTEVLQNYNANVDRYLPFQTFSTGGVTDCESNSVTVYFSSRTPQLKIGDRVYYDSNLTSVASNIGWAPYIPCDPQYIATVTDSNGFVTSLTAEVGGCC